MDTKQVLTVGLAVLGAAAMPSMAAQESIKGTFALPGESEKAVGALMVKADAVPSGLGQQVVRFEVPVQNGTDRAAQAPAKPVQGTDGPYTVKLDTSALRAGTESMMSLTVLKDGKPAQDLDTYLEVAAHAVFVSTEELDYVHAHAMAGTSAHGDQGDPGAEPAQLMLHAKLARAGPYALWIQFKGGDKIRTVPLVVTVPAASGGLLPGLLPSPLVSHWRGEQPPAAGCFNSMKKRLCD